MKFIIGTFVLLSAVLVLIVLDTNFVSARRAKNASQCRKNEEFLSSGCDQTCDGKAKKCLNEHQGCFCKFGFVRNPKSNFCFPQSKCPPTCGCNAASCPSGYQGSCDQSGNCAYCFVPGTGSQCTLNNCIQQCTNSSDCSTYCAGSGMTYITCLDNLCNCQSGAPFNSIYAALGACKLDSDCEDFCSNLTPSYKGACDTRHDLCACVPVSSNSTCIPSNCVPRCRDGISGDCIGYCPAGVTPSCSLNQMICYCGGGK